MASFNWYRGIGSPVTTDMTVDEQLAIAGLDWSVETSPVKYGTWYDSAYKRAVYRADTGLLLDCCGKNWNPYQNRELVQSMHDFCHDAALKIDHLGMLEEGRVIFASAKLDTELNIAQAGDIVIARILLFNHHKVGYGLNVRLQMERLICTNGMTSPIRDGRKTISHVSGFSSDKIQNLLKLANNSIVSYSNEAEMLAKTEIDVKQATLLLINEYGDPKLPVDDQPAIVRTCLRLFQGQAQGSELISAYNTCWGLLNSVTEFYNHHSQKRGGEATHLNSLLTGSKAGKQERFKQQLVSVFS